MKPPRWSDAEVFLLALVVLGFGTLVICRSWGF